MDRKYDDLEENASGSEVLKKILYSVLAEEIETKAASISGIKALKRNRNQRNNH